MAGAVPSVGVCHAWLSGRSTAPGCMEHRRPGPSATALASLGQGWGYSGSCCLLLLRGQAGSPFLLPHAPLAAVPLAMCDPPSRGRGITMSGQGYSPLDRLFSSLKHCKQDPAASPSSLGTGQFPPRSPCSGGIPIRCGGHGHINIRAT